MWKKELITINQDRHYGDDYKKIPMSSVKSGHGRELRNDVYYYTDQIANIVFVGKSDSEDWFLVDTGLPNSASKIIEVVQERFKGRKPQAIFLTHGHFDHAGGVVDLVNEWEVPVYAHPLELPYLTGQKAYPKPDASVEGGMLAKISTIYPTDPVQLGDSVHPLPNDHTLPGFPEWKWIHTPGHSEGHVSFYRDSDRTLIVGDAFITVKQDSFYQVLFEKMEIHEPPRYLTIDWGKAQTSVELLNELQPSYAITGHGAHMAGEQLYEDLNYLATHFAEYIPDFGRYVDENVED